MLFHARDIIFFTYVTLQSTICSGYERYRKKQQILTVHEKTPSSRHLEKLFRTEYASDNIFLGFFHLVDFFLSLVSKIIQFLFLFSCLSCDFHQNNGKKRNWYFSTGFPPWYIIIAISLSWLVLVIGFNNKFKYNFFFYFLVFHVIFIKIVAKIKELIFSHRVPTVVYHNCYIIKLTCFSRWFQ